jgi:hypothetical protein
VTGMSVQQAEIASKRLEILREMVPRLGRLAILFDVNYPASVREADNLDTAARHFRITLLRWGVRVIALRVGGRAVHPISWRQEFGRLKIEQAKRLKELELENSRLRKAVSDLTLDNLILQDKRLLGETSKPRASHRLPSVDEVGSNDGHCRAVIELSHNQTCSSLSIRRRSSRAKCESESSRAPMITIRSPRRASLTRASPQLPRSANANAWRPCRSIS